MPDAGDALLARDLKADGEINSIAAPLSGELFGTNDNPTMWAGFATLSELDGVDQGGNY